MYKHQSHIGLFKVNKHMVLNLLCSLPIDYIILSKGGILFHPLLVKHAGLLYVCWLCTCNLYFITYIILLINIKLHIKYQYITHDFCNLIRITLLNIYYEIVFYIYKVKLHYFQTIEYYLYKLVIPKVVHMNHQATFKGFTMVVNLNKIC